MRDNIAAIVAGVRLTIAAVRGALDIYKAAKGDGTVAEKVQAIHDALSKIIEKLKILAEATEPEWDDNLAGLLADIEGAIAEALIEELEG